MNIIDSLRSGRWRSALSSFLIALTLSNCGLLGPSVDHFIIRVDSIAAPGMVSPVDTLKMHFYGAVGPDGCWSLASVDRQTTAASLEMRFHGAHQVGSGFYCTAMPVSLNFEEVIPPPIGAPFTITVRQPDGSSLQRVVTAR